MIHISQALAELVESMPQLDEAIRAERRRRRRERRRKKLGGTIATELFRFKAASVAAR
jgi:hypothetical protein